MQNWNVVVTVQTEGFLRACDVLSRFGPVSRTGFLNVLVMRAEEPVQLLRAVEKELERDPELRQSLARVIPVSHRFQFQSAEEFEGKLKETVSIWAEQLGGKAFYVRMHRRGLKGRLSSQSVEKQLADGILGFLEGARTPARIRFQDPDAVLAVETVGNGAGLSLWSRDELKRYPLLKLR
jgi:tRNA(Ser,Leu) C12 N-acetylase TAN1